MPTILSDRKPQSMLELLVREVEHVGQISAHVQPVVRASTAETTTDPTVQRLGVTTLVANTTLTSAHTVVLVDTTAGNLTVTLPSAAGVSGRTYTIKRLTGGANTLTIATAAIGETIDGATTASIPTQYTSLSIISDGADWWIV